MHYCPIVVPWLSVVEAFRKQHEISASWALVASVWHFLYMWQANRMLEMRVGTHDLQAVNLVGSLLGGNTWRDGAKSCVSRNTQPRDIKSFSSGPCLLQGLIYIWEIVVSADKTCLCQCKVWCRQETDRKICWTHCGWWAVGTGYAKRKNRCLFVNVCGGSELSPDKSYLFCRQDRDLPES